MDVPRPFDRRPATSFAVLVAVSLALTASAPAFALDREVVLQFLAPENAPVTAYHVYVSEDVSGADHRLDIGYIAPGADGVTRAPVVVDESLSYTVGMTASNEFGESGLSNQIHVEARIPICDPARCDDGDPCTADSCDSGGCFSAPLPDGSSCDDGYVDTVDDQCVRGRCEGVLLACRDDGDCDDGNVCNGFEVCDGGTVCLEGIPLECGEPTACSVPRCDAVEGCLTDWLPDGTRCDDGLAETHDDVCVAGICQGIGLPDEPVLEVEELQPSVVSPGLQKINVFGRGFAAGAQLQFVNGKGRGVRVKSLRLLDGGTLEATIDVSGKGPKRSRHFDVVVTLPDGSEAILPGGLRIDP